MPNRILIEKWWDENKEAVSPEDCEVIGNRWDNPELLEEASDNDK